MKHKTSLATLCVATVAVLGLIAIPASAKKPKSDVNTVEIVNAGFAAPVPDQVTVEELKAAPGRYHGERRNDRL